MGTVFSNQNPHKLVDQISSALKANQKYISIDLNEHHLPNHKHYNIEHYITQSNFISSARLFHPNSYNDFSYVNCEFI